MDFIEKNLKPLFKKYPKLSVLLVVVVVIILIDVVYYTGKEIGKWVYYLNQ
ncbi:hypothetical protein PaeBR_15590 [Paenibacillus sp. BR2-3]|uniref:hypothetical protein n=1 Tax=Paenibacillus sp. BR2-3 TaxID=3048494 RepID=UPI00397784B3